MINRKLIRPNLSDLKDKMAAPGHRPQRKQVPPEQTNAENYYFIKQMQNKTAMVVMLAGMLAYFRKRGWLTPLYLHLVSTANWAGIIDLAAKRGL